MSDKINNYSEESIEELSQIEGARLRPQSIGFESHEHIFVEQVANGIDEAREGYGSVIEVTKYKDESISVRDYGRSIPLDYNSKTQKYNWQSIFLKMWGGGKYSNSQQGANYKKSLGTNGAGNFGSATTSEFLEVWSYKGEECHNIRFEEGKATKEFNKYKDNTTRGTKIHFKPDIKVYGENVINDDFIEIMLERQSIINGGIKFVYTNEKLNYIKEFYYENGIEDYIKKVSEGKEFTDFFKFSGNAFVKSNPQDFEADYEIHFTFNNNTKLMEYYHNSSFLPNGGLPEKVIKNSMLDIFTKYINNNNLCNKGEKVKFEDIEDSLIIIFSSGSTTSIFTDQTKKSIGHSELQKIITNEFKTYLEILLTENKLEAEKICTQIITNMRARTKAEKTKLDIKKKLQENTKSTFGKIEGLKNCDKSTPFEEREIWFSEGISPSQTMDEARDERTMGLFPLRGRFINGLKCSLKQVLNNKPALGIINALGCGIDLPKEDRKLYKDMNTFNKEDLKFNKVIIATDADSFGHGITLSLIAFFYVFMKQLLIDGHIYISISPRYEITYKDELYFAYSEEEKNKMVENFKRNGKNVNVGIVKGLGQLNKDTFWNYVMNPETRILKQITYEGAEDIIENYFDMLIGEDIENRKKYVKENITNVNYSEID